MYGLEAGISFRNKKEYLKVKLINLKLFVFSATAPGGPGPSYSRGF
jgi:hypothetical protein